MFAFFRLFPCYSEFGRSLFNNFLKMSFIIFSLSHILDGQQNQLGLVYLSVDPSGIQMHYFSAYGLKVMFHLKVIKYGILRRMSSSNSLSLGCPIAGCQDRILIFPLSPQA